MEAANGFEKMAELDLPKDAPSKDVKTGAKQDLPPLSTADFRAYNRLAEMMDAYHNHFRQTWNLLYGACESNKRPQGMSIRAFLRTAKEFASHLTMHHTIEEQHIFPVLAKKMPKFRKELELLTQHKQIHAGLEVFEEYIGACRNGERELRLGELREVMGGFGTVLWEHLDEEVKELGAENMRKYWTIAELKQIPF
ncbi:hypothetical protein LTR95_005156 [Oleoguttula sp. CCFEE 5521]